MADFVQKSHYDVHDLMQIVALLRAPDGCPWDKVQTHESIRMNFIEETYEVVDAIDQKDAHLMCEELGDVMLQVALHCQMEAEQGTFTFDEVCDGICKKLIYRHPHIFAGANLTSTDEVADAWEMLKNKAKGRTTAKLDLESVPVSLPALMRARKVQKRAAGWGVGTPDLASAMQQLEAGLARVKEALQNGEAAEEALGDFLFSAANVSRMAKVDPEEALGASTNRFTARVAACEELVRQQGKELKDLTDEQLNELWLLAEK